MDPLGGSRSFRKRAGECRAGDLLCTYGSRGMGCVTTRPRLIESRSEDRRLQMNQKAASPCPH